MVETDDNTRTMLAVTAEKVTQIASDFKEFREQAAERHGRLETKVDAVNGSVRKHEMAIHDLSQRPQLPISTTETQQLIDQFRNFRDEWNSIRGSRMEMWDDVQRLKQKEAERETIENEEGKRENFRRWAVPVGVAVLLGAPNMIVGVIGLIVLFRGG